MTDITTAFPMGSLVIVTSWGYNVPLDIVRTTGEVVGYGRTRVKVELHAQDYVGEVRAIRPDQIRVAGSQSMAGAAAEAAQLLDGE